MKTLATLTMMTLMAVTAGANNVPLGDIVTHAQAVRQEAEQLSTQLKAKQTNRESLEKGMAALEERIGKLKELVASTESAGPQLTPAQKEAWEKMKMKVDLLSVFANNKKEMMASGDIAKNRSFLKAHADGIAKRAAMLEQTASRM